MTGRRRIRSGWRRFKASSAFSRIRKWWTLMKRRTGQTLGFIKQNRILEAGCHETRQGGWPGLSQSFELTRVPRPSFAWAGPLTFFITNAMYEPSQICSQIGAKIPRQCTIENCASLQRRTHFRPQTFHRSLTTYGSDEHARKCTPNRKIRSEERRVGKEGR